VHLGKDRRACFFGWSSDCCYHWQRGRRFVHARLALAEAGGMCGGGSGVLLLPLPLLLLLLPLLLLPVRAVQL
jgi:hypothetical protein